MNILQVAIVTDGDQSIPSDQPAPCLVYLFPGRLPKVELTEEPIMTHNEAGDALPVSFKRTLTLKFDVSDYRVFQDKQLLNLSTEGQAWLLDHLLLWLGECHVP